MTPSCIPQVYMILKLLWVHPKRNLISGKQHKRDVFLSTLTFPILLIQGLMKHVLGYDFADTWTRFSYLFRQIVLGPEPAQSPNPLNGPL